MFMCVCYLDMEIMYIIIWDFHHMTQNFTDVFGDNLKQLQFRCWLYPQN